MKRSHDIYSETGVYKIFHTLCENNFVLYLQLFKITAV